MKLFRRSAVLMLIVMSSLSAVTIKLGSLAPQNSPWDDALQKLSSEWTKISNGTVNLKIYAGGVAGDESDMLRKMKANLLGGSALTGLGMNDLYSGVLAAQLPLVFKTQDEFEYVFEKMRPSFEAELEKRGAKVIIWTHVGWIRFFAKNPVISPKDMTNEKMFVYAGDGNSVEVWRDVGFNPVPLSTNDVTMALQSGMVSSFATTPLSAAALQWFGQAQNMSDMKWAPLLGGVIISTKVWNKIKPELQQKLIASAQKIGADMQDEIDDADDEAIEIMQSYGLKVHTVPEEMYSEWQKVSEKALSKVIGTMVDETSYELVKEHLADYRATHGGSE